MFSIQSYSAMLTPFILHIPYLPSRLRDRLLLTFSLLPSPPLTIPQELAEFNSATEAHLYTREPSTVLTIRHTNDCVSNPVISGTLRSVRPGGLYRYLWIVRLLEISVTVQLHGFTHEIINTLSVWICLQRCWLYVYCFDIFKNFLECNNIVFTSRQFAKVKLKPQLTHKKSHCVSDRSVM